MSQQSISVVIPAYRAAHTIGRTLSSIAAQSVQPVQTIVVDDGSPDGEELKAIVKQFTFAEYLRKSNGGVASARNFGINYAIGEWVAFLDADDYWEPTKIEKQLQIAAEYPDVDIIGCKWYDEESGQRYQARLQSEFYGHRWLPKGSQAFDVAKSMWTGSLMVRRGILAEKQFESGLEPAEDRNLWIGLVLERPIFLLEEVLATYVQYSDSLSNSNIDRDCGSMLEVIRRNSWLLDAAKVKEEKAIVYRRWASRYLARGIPTKAFPKAFRRLALEPGSMQAWWIVFKSAANSIYGVVAKNAG